MNDQLDKVKHQSKDQMKIYCNGGFGDEVGVGIKGPHRKYQLFYKSKRPSILAMRNKDIIIGVGVIVPVPSPVESRVAALAKIPKEMLSKTQKKRLLRKQNIKKLKHLGIKPKPRVKAPGNDKEEQKKEEKVHYSYNAHDLTDDEY